MLMKPNCSARLKTAAAAAIALLKAMGSLHPEPTWKLTPTIDKPKSRANDNNAGASVWGSQPYLMPSGHCVSVASQRIRITRLENKLFMNFRFLLIIKCLKTYLQDGWIDFILYNSNSLSNVVRSTHWFMAYFMCEVILAGLANIIRDGLTPKSKTFFISAYKKKKKN